MSGSPLMFWGVAAVLVGAALAVVLSKNLFHSVLWLALALTGTAVIFLTLDAEFLAAVQLLLYAGGVVTIVVSIVVSVVVSVVVPVAKSRPSLVASTAPGTAASPQ